jgi:hypothetical protein
MADTNVVVSPSNVKFGEVPGVVELIYEVRNQGKWCSVFNCDSIEATVILNRAKLAILLVNEEEGAGHRGLGWADVAAAEMLSDVFFKSNGFTRCEAIDGTFP